jgi:CheY-like chemotaxis protein
MLRHGYDVETANGGLECLAKLRHRTPDLLVLRWTLPWGGGDGILAWLREQPVDRRAPAVLVIGGSPDDGVSHHSSPVVVQHLPKTASAHEVVREVQTILGSRPSVPAE